MNRWFLVAVVAAGLGGCYIDDSYSYRRPYVVYRGQRPVPIEYARAPITVPARLHWCAAHCSTWVWVGDRYVAEGTPNPERTPQCGVRVERFSPESIVMHRTDCGPYPGRAVLTGRLSPDGNAIVGGVITWTYHPCCGLGAGRFVAAWGPAIDAVPGDDAERARRMQGSGTSPAPQPGLTRDQQVAHAVVKIGIALVANAIAQDPSAGALEAALARKGRDLAFESALCDAFPQLSSSEARAIGFFIVSALDGTLTRANVAWHFSKEAVLNELRARAPNVANLVQVADFAYEVCMALAPK